MSEIHLQKLPASPAFLICIHGLSSSCSLLSSCIMPPHLFPSFSCLPPSQPPCLPLSLCPSVSLVILHCSTCTVVQHRQSELCTHTHTRRARRHPHLQTHTHTQHRETHTHHFRQPPPSLTSFHCRHETLYNPWCASASSRDIASITSQLYSAFTHHSIPHMNPCNEK